MLKHLSIFALALELSFLTGCASSQPANIDAAAFQKPIPAIYVMPVVDARFDQSAKLDDSDFKYLRDRTKEKLEGHGYKTVMVDAWPAGADLTAQKWSAMSDADICKLAPADSQVFLVIAVTDVQDHYTGVTTSYSISGSFTAFDKTTAAKIYKDTGTGSHGGGGVIGSAAISAEKAWRAQIRFTNVLDSFPDNKK